MKTNTNFTIYNIDYDKISDRYIYIRTVISKGLWMNINGYFRRAGNLITSKDSVRLMIPLNVKATNKYIKPTKFNKLPNKQGYYTIRPEDIIVKGISGEIVNLSELDNYNTITSIDLNDYGRERMHHLDVIAK